MQLHGLTLTKVNSGDFVHWILRYLRAEHKFQADMLDSCGLMANNYKICVNDVKLQVRLTLSYGKTSIVYVNNDIASKKQNALEAAKATIAVILAIVAKGDEQKNWRNKKGELLAQLMSILERVRHETGSRRISLLGDEFLSGTPAEKSVRMVYSGTTPQFAKVVLPANLTGAIACIEAIVAAEKAIHTEAHSALEIIGLASSQAELESKGQVSHCPINEKTGDGVSVGRCWFNLKDGYICPRHGDVAQEVAVFQTTGKLTPEQPCHRGEAARKLQEKH